MTHDESERAGEGGGEGESAHARPNDGASDARHGVLLKIAYDGTAFHGWAAQKPNKDGVAVRTVEETIRGAIAAMDPRAGAVRGTSRTDAGVHAEGQLAAFDATKIIAPRGWVLGLNQHLPDDVCVREARAVPALFAPRFVARGKRYRYRVVLDRVRDPFLRTRAWRIGDALDLDKMMREAMHVLGTHDFAAFRAAGDERAVTTRTITRIDVEVAEGGRLASVVIEGNAFLYNMVRILVGTLVDVARGRIEEGAIPRALAAKERALAGTTAPAHGLTLEHVDIALPEESGEPWPP
jgi:tRNA pseudouridine38-40 synthase